MRRASTLQKGVSIMKMPDVWNQARLPRFIPRPAMPQIADQDLPALLSMLRRDGVPVSRESDPVANLRERQRVHYDLARTMPARLMRKPVLVSSDGVVLDGNHRTLAHKLNGTPVPVERLGLPFRKAIAELFRFPRVTDGQQ